VNSYEDRDPEGATYYFEYLTEEQKETAMRTLLHTITVLEYTVNEYVASIGDGKIAEDEVAEICERLNIYDNQIESHRARLNLVLNGETGVDWGWELSQMADDEEQGPAL
jgi:hypothetical protein